MSDVREKKAEPEPRVREILSGFEKGSLQVNAARSGNEERPIARPGGTRLLKQQFEQIAEPAPAPVITRKSPKSPTSPAPAPIANGGSVEEPPSPLPQPQTLPEAPAEDAESPATPLQAAEPEQPEQPEPVEAAPAPDTKAAPTEAPPAQAPPAPAPTSGSHSVLVVYADMERGGFNGQVLDATVSALKAQGHGVQVSDLYRLNLTAAPARSDAGVSATGGNFLYEEAMLTANLNNKVSEDIRAEQEKVRGADLIIFIARLSPSGLPTVLRGYTERVLSEGFAADYTSNAVFDNGKLKGKKAVLCLSCLLSAESFSSKSPYKSLDGYLWPMQYGSLRYSGIDVLPPQLNDDYFYGGDTQQKALLAAWEKRVSSLLNEEAMVFP